MKTCICLFVTIALATSGSTLRAQKAHLEISNTDPKWGETITATYTAEAGSIWANPENHDTLYFAADVRGVRPEHATIIPFRRLNDTSYQATFTVPDSSYSLWTEVCSPTDRAPNGISIFTCRTRNNLPTPGSWFEITDNFDSALHADLVTYPKDYAAYVTACEKLQESSENSEVKLSDSARLKFNLRVTSAMLSKPDTLPSWYLALASLDLRRRDDREADRLLLQSALQTDFDPIYNNANFWNHFFAPVKTKDGDYERPLIRGRLITPLIQRFPRTTMAKRWILSNGFDTLLKPIVYRQVIDSYQTSHDVDLLRAIAMAYGYRRSPLYNPATALLWYTRAEESSSKQLRFFSGDDIYGSMSRLARILAGKADMLARLGHVDDAVALAKQAMIHSKEQYEKQEVNATLARIYLESNRLEDAKRAYGIALAGGTSNTTEGLDSLYEKCGLPYKTQAEFAKALVAQYGSEVNLPPIPDFAFTTMDGVRGSLYQLRGKVVVLDFWFTTCGGCVIEKPSLNKLVDSYAGDTNIVFLSIATNDSSVLRRYLEHTPVHFKIVPDGQEICDKLGITGYPSHMIIGRDGRTLGYEMGGNPEEGEFMRPKIEAALKKL
jgi:thiol-disulfide isomerase/thioredoxin